MKKLLITLLIIVTLIVIFGMTYKSVLKNFYPQEFSEYVDKYSEKYEIDKEWIYAIIKAESNFNVESVSQSGAIGLMQLMEETAVEESNEMRKRRT